MHPVSEILFVIAGVTGLPSGAIVIIAHVFFDSVIYQDQRVARWGDGMFYKKAYWPRFRWLWYLWMLSLSCFTLAFLVGLIESQFLSS